MGNNPSKEESDEKNKKFYELTDEEQNTLLRSFVKLNDLRIRLEDAGFHHVILDDLLESLTPEQINKILNGDEISIKFEQTKSSPSKNEEKKTKKDRDECKYLEDKAFASISFDRKAAYASNPSLYERNLKSVIKFENLPTELKNKILNSTVKFQGFNVKLNDLVDGNEELCNYLSGSEIETILKGRTLLSLFRPLEEAQTNFNEIYFMRNENSQEKDEKNDYSDDYAKYTKESSYNSEIDYVSLINENIKKILRPQKADGSENKSGEKF